MPTLESASERGDSQDNTLSGAGSGDEGGGCSLAHRERGPLWWAPMLLALLAQREWARRWAFK